MKLNSAASVFTKDISMLGMGELIQVSLAIAAIIAAVVLIFGVKTYLHWRKHPARPEGDCPAVEEIVEHEADRPIATHENFPPVEVRKVLGEIRRPATIRHIID